MKYLSGIYGNGQVVHCVTWFLPKFFVSSMLVGKDDSTQTINSSQPIDSH